jgi:hypothetical protein
MNYLLDNFGTHGLNDISFGAKVVIKNTYSKTEQSLKQAKGESFSVSVDIGGIGGGTSDSSSTSSTKSNGSANDNWDVFTVGTPLPSGANVKE